MLASFVITLREGIEAALIVAIVLAYLKKVGAEALAKSVYVGVLLGVLGSVVVAGAFVLLSVEFEGRFEEVFEGTTMFLAAAILTTMIVWMQRNGKAYSQGLREKVEIALTDKASLGLTSLAFVSVFREGVETVLFLGSASFTSSGMEILIGGAIGLGTAIVIGLAMMRYSVHLDLRLFFRVTGVFLMLFAAGLVAHGIHEFEEAGLVSPIVANVYDINWLIDDHSDLGRLLTALVGYNGNPSLTEILGYVLYWVLVSSYLYRDSVVGMMRRVGASVRPS